MALQNARVIDRVGIEADTGHVVLTVVDEMDWSDDQRHLLALQQKLNTYLSFVERGEVFRRIAWEGGRTLPRTTPVKVGSRQASVPTTRWLSSSTHGTCSRAPGWSCPATWSGTYAMCEAV